MGGLFIIKAAVLLQLAAQLYGGVGIGESVQPDDDSGVGATGRAGGGHPQLLVFEQAVAAPGHPVALQVKIGRIGLYAGTALGHRLAGDLGTVLGIDHGGAHRAPAKLYLAGIAAQLAVGLAAQQLVGRHAQRLAADILQGNVDGADGGKHDDPAAQAPKRLAVERVPHRFAVHGVHAEDEPGKIQQQAAGPVAAGVGDARLAKAADAAAGVDPDDERLPMCAGDAGLGGGVWGDGCAGKLYTGTLFCPLSARERPLEKQLPATTGHAYKNDHRRLFTGVLAGRVKAGSGAAC